MNTARNESTCETCPRHIWMHEVTMVAIGLGADAELVRAQGERLGLWYRSGEPVWMAGEGVAFMVKQGQKEARADHAADGLRRVLRQAMKGA
jgi:hypothetical protein